MKAAPFVYHAPRTLPDALAMVSSLRNAKLLAGGQSLVPMLNIRSAVPDHVIDLNRVVGLTGIAMRAEGVVEIGALTRHHELETSPEIARHLPLFTEALPHVGYPQTRSRGTIGGSLCHLDPAAELPALCLLADAEICALSQRGERRIPVSKWFRGFMQPALEADEIVTSVNIPVWPQGHGYGFSEFSRGYGGAAIAGAAATVMLGSGGTIDRCAIVVFGVDAHPRRLAQAEKTLLGTRPTPLQIADAGEAVHQVPATNDATAQAAYQKKVGAAMVRRALTTALNRATDAQR